MTTDAQKRKETPIFSGVLMYFPDAIAEVARCSFIGNEQHNPGTPLHWDRAKSQDEKDALVRHLMEAGKIDKDGIRHSAKVAWRALANLQKEIEDFKRCKMEGEVEASIKENLLSETDPMNIRLTSVMYDVVGCDPYLKK